jgi:hypothetical protein
MTTLRDFQNEISNLQMKESAKQRATTILEREKDTKKHAKLKDKDNPKPKDKETTAEDETAPPPNVEVDLNGVEDDRIQVC